MKNKLLLSCVVPGLIVLIRPFGITLTQSIVLATLILTIIWWVSNIVNKTIASIFMLIVFSIFGSTPLERIFQFPLSTNFVLIVFSFIFSEGIMNSGLTEKLIEPILQKVSNSIVKLLLSILALNIALIFIIPQPFSRIIILGMILNQFFLRREFDESLSQIFLFYTFSLSAIVNMMFLRGDIILNNALITIAQIEVSEMLWIKIMLVPTLIFIFLYCVMFYIVFKKELSFYKYSEDHCTKTEKLTKRDYISLAIILLVVLLWATEPLHGISSTFVILLGTGLMAIFRLISFKDLKSVNIGLLLFITAAFSIGVVMNNSGIASIIFSPLSKLLPTNFSITYILIVMGVSVLMHMILGSNITTMSVMIPSLMLIANGVAPSVILAFIIYISVCAHYILPFHNVIVLIGNGKGLYDSKVVAKYGVPLTALLAVSIIGIYFSWWKIINII